MQDTENSEVGPVSMPGFGDNSLRVAPGGPSFSNATSQPSIADRLRNATSIDVGGGQLSPEIGGGKVGFRWNKTFKNGGKIDLKDCRVSTGAPSKTHSSW